MPDLEIDYMEYFSNTTAQATYVSDAPSPILITNGTVETWPTDTMSNILSNPGMDSWGTTELFANNTFETWSSATVCTSWTLWNSVSGGTINRESSIIKAGTYSARITSTGTACGTYQVIDTAGGHTQAYWKGRTITWGCWVYATVPSLTHLAIWDSIGGTNGNYHTGNSTWQWLTCTHTCSLASTFIYCVGIIEAGVATSAYFDNASCPEIVNLPLNPSFETWTGLTEKLTDGGLETWTNATTLTNWTYSQDGGSGGALNREATIIKAGTYSAKITNSDSTHASYIAQNYSATAHRSKVLILGCWIKSANTVANKVGIVLGDSIGTWATEFYQNTGNWEYISTSFLVNAAATSIHLQLRVEPAANAVAYYDKASSYEQLPPTSWNIGGVPATVALNRVSREEGIIKSNTYSMKYSFTYDSAGQFGDIYQDITSLGGHNLAYWKGKTITVGCWCWSNVSTAGFYVTDGIFVNIEVTHTGNSTWQWLQGSGVVSSSATRLYVIPRHRNTSGTATAYYDDFMAYDTIPPQYWTLDANTTLSTTEPNTSIVHTAGGCSTKFNFAYIPTTGTRAGFYQDIQNLGGRNLTYWKGKKVTYGCWVWASVANRAHIFILDNVIASYSSFHTGNSTWQYLTVTGTISATAANVLCGCEITGGSTTAYIDDAIVYENFCPTFWTNAGNSTDGSYIERVTSPKVSGSYSAKMTRVGNDCWLNRVIASASYLNHTLTLGAWVYATVASRAYVNIFDGVGSTNSSYHTGNSTWQWLQVTRTISGSATLISASLTIVTGDTSAYIDDMQLVDGTAGFESITGTLNILTAFSEPTIKTQGSYSIKGFAATTGSLNKTLIKIIASGLNLTEIYGVRFDIRASRIGSNIKVGLYNQLTSESTGGTITTDGRYTVHKFTASGTFTSAHATNVEYLIVAGGGAGGRNPLTSNRGGGGGGAGGLIYNTSYAVTAQGYSIVIGSGGILGAYNSPGGSGGNSSAFGVTAIGGGGGGRCSYLVGSGTPGPGQSGGSGGGGANYNGIGGDADYINPRQGYDGGAAGGGDIEGGCGGGGGGAGGVGGVGGVHGGVGGVGGAGFISDILVDGNNVTYATGGAGGRSNADIIARNGANNTGEGGEGNRTYDAGTGGSGIVIIRYLTPTSIVSEITPNILSSNTWQTVTLDLASVLNINKNSIDQLKITIVNADADNTFYLDNFKFRLPVRRAILPFFKN